MTLFVCPYFKKFTVIHPMCVCGGGEGVHLHKMGHACPNVGHTCLKMDPYLPKMDTCLPKMGTYLPKMGPYLLKRWAHTFYISHVL